MTENRLRQVLFDLVEEVDAPPLAETAWATAARRRRRGYVAVGAVAAIAVVGTMAGVAMDHAAPSPIAARPTIATGPDSRPDRAEIEPAPTAPTWDGPQIQSAPAANAIGALPSLSTPWSALSDIPRSAPALSESPVSRVIAAVQQGPGEPVLLLGSGGGWRRLDAAPASSTSTTSSTDTSLMLGGMSFSPDGRRIAGAATDGLVVVDLTTRDSLFLPAAPDRIDYLTWLPSGQEIAAGGDAGSAIYSLDGNVRPIDYIAGNLASGPPGGPLLELTRSAVVNRGHDPVTSTPLDAGQIRLDDWYGGAHLNGDQLASTWFVNKNDKQAVATVDLTSGRLKAILEFSYDGRSQGCCPTLGWLDEHTVLLRDMGHILAWRPSTGELLRVAEVPGGQNTEVALLP